MGVYSNNPLIGSLQRAATSIFPPLHLMLDKNATRLMLPQTQFITGSAFPNKTKYIREQSEKKIKEVVASNLLPLVVVGGIVLLLISKK